MSLLDTVSETFERWCPGGFVVGGLGILGTAVVGSLHVAGIVASPEWIAMGPLLLGLWFVLVGLVGLYPYVAERSPRVSLAGLGTGGIGLIAWSVSIVAAIIVDITSERTFADPGTWGPPLLAVAFILALLSFLAFGIASTRTATPSRTIGILLLVPVVAFFGQAVLLLSKILTGEVIAVLQLGLGGIIGVVLIAVGFLVQYGRKGAAGTESRVEPMT
jgi:hypothetical protein